MQIQTLKQNLDAENQINAQKTINQIIRNQAKQTELPCIIETTTQKDTILEKNLKIAEVPNADFDQLNQHEDLTKWFAENEAKANSFKSDKFID